MWWRRVAHPRPGESIRAQTLVRPRVIRAATCSSWQRNVAGSARANSPSPRLVWARGQICCGQGELPGPVRVDRDCGDGSRAEPVFLAWRIRSSVEHCAGHIPGCQVKRVRHDTGKRDKQERSREHVVNSDI